MSQKPPDEQSINGSFSFKGENMFGINIDFFEWCEQMEKKYGVRLISNRCDYTNYYPVDRTSDKDRK